MTYYTRDLEENILKYTPKREMIAVIGTRQCGKTTLISKILDGLEAEGKRISRVSFDHVTDLELFETDLTSFVQLHVRDRDILFIDEVQYAKESGKKLKYIFDTFGIKIFISGSSSAEISIQSLKHLVGRIFIFTLHPFSFREFVRACSPRLFPLYESGKYGNTVLEELNRLFHAFVRFGGYPRVLLSDDDEERRKVLEGIYNTHLLREVREIMHLPDDFRMVRLVKSLALQTGGIINYNDLSRRSELSYPRLKEYLNILEKTFICGFVPPWHRNRNTELVKQPKVYFHDTGFRNTCINDHSLDRVDAGALFENFVFSELIKVGLEPGYWRTRSGAEVDYIITCGSKVIPVEVKTSQYNVSLPRSFSSFIEKYRPLRGYILSTNFEERRTVKGCDVHFLPFVKLHFRELQNET